MPFFGRKGASSQLLPQCQYIRCQYGGFFHEIRALKGLLTGKDLLILTGGGNLGNQYPDDERIRRKTIETFPKNKIVLFPQTFFFTQDEDGKKRKNHSKYLQPA